MVVGTWWYLPLILIPKYWCYFLETSCITIVISFHNQQNNMTIAYSYYFGGKLKNSLLSAKIRKIVFLFFLFLFLFLFFFFRFLFACFVFYFVFVFVFVFVCFLFLTLLKCHCNSKWRATGTFSMSMEIGDPYLSLTKFITIQGLIAKIYWGLVTIPTVDVLQNIASVTWGIKQGCHILKVAQF